MNDNCPCKKKKCERHGDCDACRAYHAESKRKRPCERIKKTGRISLSTLIRGGYRTK